MSKIMTKTSNKTALSGFTLVELSIVLVIVGLLIGGVLVGQSLIDSARVNLQVSQFQQFDVALNQFWRKYKCIPGDCGYDFAKNGSGTYGGNDNDRILEAGNPATLWSTNDIYGEVCLFFPDLYGSGLKGGNNNWVACDAVGIEFPASKIRKNYGIVARGNSIGEIFYFHGIVAGSTNVNFATRAANGSLSPAESLALDAKMDDNLPGTGDVVAVTTTAAGSGGVPYPFTLNTTAAACTMAGTAYNTSRSSELLCNLLVKAQLTK